MKNMGFSSSARATEPQVPEGTVMLALRQLKACSVMPPGYTKELKEEIKI